MSKPRPVMPRCPECGARIVPNALECWLCRRIREQILADAIEAEKTPVFEEVPRHKNRDQPFQFSLQTLFFVTAAFAVVAGVYRVAPGLSYVVAAVVAMALVVALERSDQRRSTAKILGGVVLGLLIGMALVIGVFLTCLYVVLGGQHL